MKPQAYQDKPFVSGRKGRIKNPLADGRTDGMLIALVLQSAS
jgi:hypothetical protein